MYVFIIYELITMCGAVGSTRRPTLSQDSAKLGSANSFNFLTTNVNSIAQMLLL